MAQTELRLEPNAASLLDFYTTRLPLHCDRICTPHICICAARLSLCASSPLQVEYVRGWGKLKSAGEVEVAAADGSTSMLAAKNIIIATGSEVTPLPGVPVDERR